MSFNDVLRQQRNAKLQKDPSTGYTSGASIMPTSIMPTSVDFESESDSDEITLEYIINEKPKTKIVREFFRENLTDCRSEVFELFED